MARKRGKERKIRNIKEDNYELQIIIDKVVKSLKTHIFVIPVKMGIQSFQVVAPPLDTRFRGYDDFLRDRHNS